MSGLSGGVAGVTYGGAFRSVTATGDLVTAAENVRGGRLLTIGFHGRVLLTVGGRSLVTASSTSPDPNNELFQVVGLAPIRLSPGEAVTATFIAGGGRAWCKVVLG